MNHPTVVALTGGVGGAKLALGLYSLLPPHALALVVNTADDFVHCNLTVCPDLDTTLYTLAGIANPEVGWGRHDETWTCHDELRALGRPTWFRLGDRDLAVHLSRSEQLAAGSTLCDVTHHFAQRLGVHASVWPMSNDPVRTLLDTEQGELAFQEYFVRERCVPVVRSIRFSGSDRAVGLPAAVAALTSPLLEAIVICPSNPLLSIDPILSIPELRTALAQRRAPCVAVSPLIAGKAVKGPTAKLMMELGIPVGAASVAAHYGELIDGFIVDYRDGAAASALRIPGLVTDTLMVSVDDRVRLAREALRFSQSLQLRAEGSICPVQAV